MILLNMTKPPVGGIVLMSEPFIHSFNRFIQTADSFRNESIVCPFEWASESLTHSIHSKTWFHSVTNHFCCSETHNSSAVALIATIFISEIEQKQSAFCLKSKSLNFNLLFIEIILYKISVTLQTCCYCYSGKHHGRLMLLTKSYFVNLFFFFYRSMHLYISESYSVCAVSLTHSLRLCKPRLARHKYIFSCRLHWMPFKLESFSRETTCFTRDCEYTGGCDVSACAAGNKRVGSES